MCLKKAPTFFVLLATLATVDGLPRNRHELVGDDQNEFFEHPLEKHRLIPDKYLGWQRHIPSPGSRTTTSKQLCHSNKDCGRNAYCHKTLDIYIPQSHKSELDELGTISEGDRPGICCSPRSNAVRPCRNTKLSARTGNSDGSNVVYKEMPCFYGSSSGAKISKNSKSGDRPFDPISGDRILRRKRHASLDEMFRRFRRRRRNRRGRRNGRGRRRKHRGELRKKHSKSSSGSHEKPHIKSHEKAHSGSDEKHRKDSKERSGSHEEHSLETSGSRERKRNKDHELSHKPKHPDSHEQHVLHQKDRHDGEKIIHEKTLGEDLSLNEHERHRTRHPDSDDGPEAAPSKTSPETRRSPVRGFRTSDLDFGSKDFGRHGKLPFEFQRPPVGHPVDSPHFEPQIRHRIPSLGLPSNRIPSTDRSHIFSSVPDHNRPGHRPSLRLDGLAGSLLNRFIDRNPVGHSHAKRITDSGGHSGRHEGVGPRTLSTFPSFSKLPRDRSVDSGPGDHSGSTQTRPNFGDGLGTGFSPFSTVPRDRSVDSHGAPSGSTHTRPDFGARTLSTFPSFSTLHRDRSVDSGPGDHSGATQTRPDFGARTLSTFPSFSTLPRDRSVDSGPGDHSGATQARPDFGAGLGSGFPPFSAVPRDRSTGNVPRHKGRHPEADRGPEPASSKAGPETRRSPVRGFRTSDRESLENQLSHSFSNPLFALNHNLRVKFDVEQDLSVSQFVR